jgi:hypothetical protein
MNIYRIEFMLPTLILTILLLISLISTTYWFSGKIFNQIDFLHNKIDQLSKEYDGGDGKIQENMGV